MSKISQTISNTKRFAEIVTILYKNGFDDIANTINSQYSFKLPIIRDFKKDKGTSKKGVFNILCQHRVILKFYHNSKALSSRPSKWMAN